MTGNDDKRTGRAANILAAVVMTLGAAFILGLMFGLTVIVWAWVFSMIGGLL